MKIENLEKKEPKLVEFKEEQQLSDKNIQLFNSDEKTLVQVKKESYKRPNYLYRLL